MTDKSICSHPVMTSTAVVIGQVRSKTEYVTEQGVSNAEFIDVSLDSCLLDRLRVVLIPR
jgi:hypothetical protein